jgi:hypothetical protein
MKKIILSSLFIIVSNISIAQPLDSAKIARLEFFAKAYNLVKFFYPADELVDFPWDNWTAHKVESIIHIKNDEEYIDSMQCFFEEIAPGVAILPRNVPYPSSLITPPNPLEYQDTTFFQYGLGLNTPEVNDPITLNYRYKRTPNNRNYLEIKNLEKYKGEKLKIEVIAKTTGVNIKDTNFIFELYNKNDITNKPTQTYIFKVNGSNYDTFIKELTLDKNINTFHFKMKYPSEDYILQVKKHNVSIWLDTNWTDIETIAPNVHVKSPIIVLETDYIKDSLHTYNLQNAYNFQRYTVKDTIPYLNYQDFKFYVPLKLSFNNKGTFPSIYKDITYYKNPITGDSSKLYQSISYLSKAYGYLFYDYPYTNDIFKEDLSFAFANAIKNRVKAPKRKFIIWFENEFLNQLGDPHMDLKRVKNYKINKVSFFRITRIDGKVYIEKSSDTSFLKLGDEILKIDNTSINSIFKKLKYNTNLVQKDRYLHNVLFEKFNIKDKIKITYLRNQRIDSVEISTFYDSKKTIKTNHIFLKINDSISYFDINANIDNEFDSKIRQKGKDYIKQKINEKSIHYLIFRGKLEWLDDSFNLFSIFGDSFNKDILINKTKILPFHEYSWDTSTLLYSKFKNKKEINNNIKIIIIIDRYVQSSEELYLFPLINHPQVTLVGENTAGAFGIINRVYLNDEYDFDYTSNKMGYIDKKGIYHNYHYKGITPNILLPRDAASFRDHTDFFLDKTIEMIQNGSLEKMRKKIE